ncbi:MAG: hypothetical protein ACI8VC_002123 [Candidatus Endobugula sp.]
MFDDKFVSSIVNVVDKKMKFSIILSVAVVAVFTLVACKGGGQSVRIAQDYVKQPAVYQKPGAALMLQNSQVNLEVAGAQYAVDVVIINGYGSGDMVLSVTASDGLHIVSGDTQSTVSLAAGNINQSYSLIAEEAGRYYLYLNAMVTKNGRTLTRALTFIVQVGEEQLKDETSISVEKTGTSDTVITMPAKEEIIR